MANQLPPVVIEEFEGPFDLLIELAQQSKIDLSTISLTKITDAFIATIDRGRFTPALIADFLVVASTLLLLKVRQLLPELEGEEEAAIAQLSDRVRIYQLYREQAQIILSQWRPWLLPSPALLAVAYPLPMPSVTAEELAATMAGIIERVKAPRSSTHHLRLRGKTLQECITFLQERLRRRPTIILQDELAQDTPDTLAVSFLAVLEMSRQRQVDLHQPDLFAPIQVTARR